MANPVLTLKMDCFAVEMVENIEFEALQVRKMDAPQPVVRAIADLVFFVSDDRVPTVRKGEFICLEIPVPEAVVGAAHCQRVSLLNFSELEISMLFLQARPYQTPVSTRAKKVRPKRNKCRGEQEVAQRHPLQRLGMEPGQRDAGGQRCRDDNDKPRERQERTTGSDH